MSSKLQVSRSARAFTLVELLTVIGIISILSAILMPAMVAARGLAIQYSTMQSLGQIGTAATMYEQDNDETFMPALYQSGRGVQAWFGLQNSVAQSLPGALTTSTASGQSYDPKFGLLTPYMGGKHIVDPAFQGKPYFGDHSGFGYNWAYLGSDFGVTLSLAGFPDCIDEANASQLKDSSSTVVFASSSYYFATWLPKGDGQVYDFGMIDAPSFWSGNPDVDFRFGGTRQPDSDLKIVFSTGNALIAYADSHTAARKQSQLTDANFTRS